MPNTNPESLVWLDNLASLTAQLEKTPDASHASLAKAIKLHKSMVTFLSAIKLCFDPAALDKVHQAANKNPPYILSFNSAKALAGLKKAKAGDLTAFHDALDVTLSRQLNPAKIEALVKWIAQGHPADSFNESEIGKRNKSDKRAIKDKNQPHTGTLPSDLKKVIALSFKADAEITRGDGQTTAQDELKAFLKTISAETTENEDSGKEKTRKKSKSTSDDPSLIWEAMLGVKFMSQLRSKAKKGTLTTNDKLLILFDKGLVKPLGWVFENLGHLLKKIFKGLWHSVEEAFGKTFKKILDAVLPLLIILALFWAVWKVLQFGVFYPLHWIESKVVSAIHWGDSTTAEAPTPAPQTVRSKELEVRSSNRKPKTSNSAPIASYQPSTSFQTTAANSSSVTTLYNPQLLQQEIAAVPKNSIIKAFPLTPDETMPGDLAVSRLQDLTDPDKYTMKLGGDTEKISSVNATTTNFIVNFKSTDPFHLDGSGPLNLFWEDVLYIHSDEIDGTKPASVMYQCSLVVKGAKNVFTVQCASSDDLEHLVSTMEYFIRNSRLSHDTALAGMPYPSQGLKMNNQNLVEILWAGSPVDKSGLQIGDMLWSLEKNTPVPQDRKSLETALRTLAPGPHNLYAANNADFTKAQSDVAFNRAGSLNPKRHKVVLVAS